MNADGLMDSRDLYLQRDRFRAINAPAAATDAAVAAVLKRGDLNQDGVTNVADIDHMGQSFGSTLWRYDLDVDGWPTPSPADRQDADVLIRTIFETEYGDADLNGQINFDDYARIDNGFNNSLAGWSNGDFDGNGAINFDDYALIDLAFNSQLGSLPRAISFLNGDDPSGHGMNATPGLKLVQDHFADFGAGYANAFLTAVPEPASSVLLLGLLPFVGRRRRKARL
jgi:hypothetical protein